MGASIAHWCCCMSLNLHLLIGCIFIIFLYFISFLDFLCMIMIINYIVLFACHKRKVGWLVGCLGLTAL